MIFYEGNVYYMNIDSYINIIRLNISILYILFNIFKCDFLPHCSCTRTLPGSDVQLTPVDDTGQFEQHGEPPPHPHSVLLWNVQILSSVIFEHLQQTHYMYCKQSLLFKLKEVNSVNCTMEEQYHLKSFSEIRISFLQTLQSFGQFLFKIILTWGFSATYLAQFLISRIASILVSGKAALQANSDRHFTASWNESMMDAKCFSHMLAISRLKIIRNEY